jgi:uncharacterized protein (TIGR03083 family)
MTAGDDRTLVLHRLRVTPGLLRNLARDCDGPRAWQAPAPGEWSIGEVVRHLVEGERDAFLPRLRRMLAEERPRFESRRPAAGDGADFPTLLAAFESARTQALAILARLTPEQWARSGVSPSRGVVTIDEYARTMDAHDTEHLGQIQDVRDVLGLPPKRTEARRALGIPELLDELRPAPGRLTAMAEGLSAAELRERPAEGEWSIKEVMGHLLHVEATLFLPRLRRLVAEDGPVFEPFSPDTWAKEADRREGSFAADLEAFARVRGETVAFLAALPPAAADRPGRSGFFGPLTLALYATHIADHDLEHLAQMRAGRDVVRAGGRR